MVASGPRSSLTGHGHGGKNAEHRQLRRYSHRTWATAMRGSWLLHMLESRVPIWQSEMGLAAKNETRFWRTWQHHCFHRVGSVGGRVNSGRMALKQHSTRSMSAPGSCVLRPLVAGTLQMSKVYPSQTAVGSHCARAVEEAGAEVEAEEVQPQLHALPLDLLLLAPPQPLPQLQVGVQVVPLAPFSEVTPRDMVSA